jgi:hypothetical protein
VVQCEQQVALDKALEPVDWEARSAWVRGIFDVAVHKDDTVYLFDYKTGSVRNNSLQMKMFVALASKVYPGTKTYRTRYLWLKHQKTTGEDYTANDVGPIWEMLHEKINEVLTAWRVENFPCRPSGLCRGWCPVSECLHYRERR